MPSLRPLYSILRLAVACAILAIGLRTWLVMGVIEPVTIAGSSMVPNLRGTFVSPECPECRHSFSVGAEFSATAQHVTCPQCDHANVPLDSLALHRGDRIWIDRLTLDWRRPQRWELVVARNPSDATELCIKRVVGLPGEQVDLVDGDVLINGTVVIKTIREQRRVRQLVHRESDRSQRWLPAKQTSWRLEDDVWQCNGQGQSAVDWLHYRHPRSQPVSDDVTYNAGLTRRLNSVDEFMLSGELRLGGRGDFTLAIDDGTSSVQVQLSYPGGKLELTDGVRPSSERQNSTAMLSAASLAQLADGAVRVEFGNFDQQLLLVIDDQVVLQRPWPATRGAATTSATGTDSPFAIGVQGLDVSLSDLRLYRDIYHTSHPVAAPQPRLGRWLLGPDAFFLLGDNAPVSADSRLWGPVPTRLIVGKPLLIGR